ncbi:MAG: glycosyltransferase family 2 protein [Acidimicrobiia bacterium]
MPDRTSVTVVMPTRNRPVLAAQAIDSALNQPGADMHVVVVDDASDEDVVQALKELASDRVTLVQNPERSGACVSRNRGLAAVETPWVAFLDDDDLAAPGRYPKLVSAIDNAHGEWGFASVVYVDGKLEVLGIAEAPPSEGLAQRLLSANAIPGGGSALVARTDLVRAVGGMRPGMLGVEDWDLALRLAREVPAVSLNDVLLAYRVQLQSHSHRADVIEQVHGLFTEAWQDERRAAALPEHDRDVELYMARQWLHNANRLKAAKRFASVAVHYRQPKWLVHAAIALAAPNALEEASTKRWRARVPATTMAEIERWLRPYRTLPTPTRITN